MESDGDRRRRQHEDLLSLPVSLYLDDALKRAIDRQDAYGIDRALRHQRQNNITESISNHLLARSFFLEEKNQLAMLHGKLPEVQTVKDAVEVVGGYVARLESQFDTLFVSDDPNDTFAKLSGDSLFRAALRASAKGNLAIARHISEIDMSILLPPDQLFYEMDFAQESIAEDLWGGVHNLRENGIYPDTIESVQDVVALQIETIDDGLLHNLPRAKATGQEPRG